MLYHLWQNKISRAFCNATLSFMLLIDDKEKQREAMLLADVKLPLLASEMHGPYTHQALFHITCNKENAESYSHETFHTVYTYKGGLQTAI